MVDNFNVCFVVFCNLGFCNTIYMCYISCPVTNTVGGPTLKTGVLTRSRGCRRHCRNSYTFWCYFSNLTLHAPYLAVKAGTWLKIAGGRRGGEVVVHGGVDQEVVHTFRGRWTWTRTLLTRHPGWYQDSLSLDELPRSLPSIEVFTP